MNLFVLYESFIIGAKEGLKVGAVLVILYALLYAKEKGALIKSYYGGLILAFLFSLPFLFFKELALIKEYIRNFISLTFAILFILSGLILIHKTGTDLLEPFRPMLRKGVSRQMGGGVLRLMILFATLLFFLPDSAGSALYLRDYTLMKETIGGVYVPAFLGFILIFVVALYLLRFQQVLKLGGLFDLPQFLLFLAIVKLLGGGIKGFAELSLIPSVQRGFMKFIHDLIHQIFVMFMVPDHPLLKTTVWNFIGFFFGPNIASIASLFLLLFLPLLFIYYSILGPLPEPSGLKGSEKRKVKFHILSERRRKAIPVAIYIMLILFFWFSGSRESVTELYNPAPRPLVSDKGIVLIPLTDPSLNLYDGKLHKFSIDIDDVKTRLLVIKRPNGSLAVCLDACEICPPEGYGQRQDHVVCIYCNTPIPIKTLGEPGGCNPIPLVYSRDERFVRIELQEIIKKWQYAKTGKGH